MVQLKGVTHTLADRLSRYHNTENHCSDCEERFSPIIASKSLRTKESGYTPPDPHILKIAEIGKTYEDYAYIISCIQEKIPIANMKKDTELKTIQAQYNNLSLHKTDAGEIIERDGQDIYIPKDDRQSLIDELHSTHLSDWSKIYLTKGHAYWPTMKEDL